MKEDVTTSDELMKETSSDLCKDVFKNILDNISEDSYE